MEDFSRIRYDEIKMVTVKTKLETSGRLISHGHEAYADMGRKECGESLAYRRENPFLLPSFSIGLPLSTLDFFSSSSSR